MALVKMAVLVKLLAVTAIISAVLQTGTDAELYEWSCSPLDTSTNHYTFPNLDYGDDEYVANASFAGENLEKLEIFSVSSPLNCSGTVSAIQFCYTASADRGTNENDELVLTLLLLMKQDNFTFLINNTIEIYSRATVEKCTDTDANNRTCCDVFHLNTSRQFTLPTTNFAFGILQEVYGSIRYRSELFPEFGVERYSVSDSNLQDRNRIIVDDMDSNNSTLPLLQFVINPQPENSTTLSYFSKERIIAISVGGGGAVIIIIFIIVIVALCCRKKKARSVIDKTLSPNTSKVSSSSGLYESIHLPGMKKAKYSTLSVNKAYASPKSLFTNEASTVAAKEQEAEKEHSEKSQMIVDVECYASTDFVQENQNPLHEDGIECYARTDFVKIQENGQPKEDIECYARTDFIQSVTSPAVDISSHPNITRSHSGISRDHQETSLQELATTTNLTVEYNKLSQFSDLNLTKSKIGFGSANCIHVPEELELYDHTKHVSRPTSFPAGLPSLGNDDFYDTLGDDQKELSPKHFLAASTKELREKKLSISATNELYVNCLHGSSHELRSQEADDGEGPAASQELYMNTTSSLPEKSPLPTRMLSEIDNAEDNGLGFYDSISHIPSGGTQDGNKRSPSTDPPFQSTPSDDTPLEQTLTKIISSTEIHINQAYGIHTPLSASPEDDEALYAEITEPERQLLQNLGFKDNHKIDSNGSVHFESASKPRSPTNLKIEEAVYVNSELK